MKKLQNKFLNFRLIKESIEKSQIFIRRGKNYKYKNYEYSFGKRVTEKILNLRLMKIKSKIQRLRIFVQ